MNFQVTSITQAAVGGTALASTSVAKVESDLLEPDFVSSGEMLKRCLDVVLAMLALAVLSPIIMAIALLVWRSTGGRIIFPHRRVGRNGHPFNCYKFQTMVQNSEHVLATYLAANDVAAQEWNATRKLRFDPRVTPLGRILRRTSLDELPQLFNILLGSMSFVGPRPITFHELERYGGMACHYLKASPGLTGLWQVSGRSNVSYAERVRLDMAYLRKRSVGLDLLILLRTFYVVTKIGHAA